MLKRTCDFLCSFSQFLTLRPRLIQFSHSFSTYQDAIEYCGENYSSSDAVSFHVKHAQQLLQDKSPPTLLEADIRIHGALFLAQKAKSVSIKVLDFGGAAGIHFLRLPEECKSKISKWVVCDTIEMLTACESIHEDKCIEFISSLESCEEDFDLIIASGSIQYTPDPPDIIRKLFCKAPYILLDRIPLLNSPKSYIVAQTIRNISGDLFNGKIAMHIFSKTDFMNEIVEASHLLCQWKTQEHFWYYTQQINFEGFLIQSDGKNL